MEVNPTVAEMDSAQAEARAGTPARPIPHIELCIPTVHDPSLAPEGKHVVTIDVNSQPYTLAEGDWDSIRDEVADRAIAKLDELLPGPHRVGHRPPGAGADRPRVACSASGAATRCTARCPSTSSSTCARCAAGPTTAPRSSGLWLCGAGTHPGRRGDRRQRPQLRPRGAARGARPAGAPARVARGEPALPARVGRRSRRPRSRSTPPGPRSREVLDRVAAHRLSGHRRHLTPFALAEKRAWTATDLDGNVYLDCASASASVPLGAGRPEVLGPAIAAIERYGNEDSHALVSELTAELGERLLAIAPPTDQPLRHRPQRHRGGRDRDQDDAPRDRPAGDHRLPWLLPRRVDADRGARRRGGRDLQRAARAGARVRPRALPAPVRGRRFAIRDPAAAATRPSTTSATTCSSTPSTRPTSPAS